VNHKIILYIELCVFALIAAAIFFSLSINSPHNAGIYVVGFLLVFSAAGYLSYRLRRRSMQYIRRVTDEVSTLPTELSETATGFIPEELREFYAVLVKVKIQFEKKGKMRQELLDIANTVASYMEIEELLHDLLPKLNAATRSTCSAFYSVNNSTNKLEIRHSVGFSKNIYGEFDILLGEGFIGRAAIKKEILLVKDIPDDTVFVTRTFLGKIKPRCLMVVPITAQDHLSGVLVCASIYDYSQEDQDMIELARHYMGVAVINGVNYEKTKRLANELAFQNKLIQEQYEEMKQRLDEKTRLLNSMLAEKEG
jgi:transcriptional regulator with GAF, ATPase, and Fis domain